MHNWILHDREIIEEYVVSALFFWMSLLTWAIFFYIFWWHVWICLWYNICSIEFRVWRLRCFLARFFQKSARFFFVKLKWVSFQLPELVFLYLLVTRLDDLCDLGGLSFSGLRCAGMSSIEGLSTGPRRLSGNGDRFWLRRSEMSSGLTSDDMEAGGIEGGPGDCFLT